MKVNDPNPYGKLQVKRGIIDLNKNKPWLAFFFLTGLGFGLATASTLVALNSYFNIRRGQAVGLAMTGTALGFMAMPQAISIFMEEYEFRGTLLILSALALNAAVGASLLQPVQWHMKLAPIKPPNKAKDGVPAQV